MADVAFWGYGFAALGFFLFALYVFFAWRGGLPGGLLFFAVVSSFLWALAGIAGAHTSSGTLTWVSLVLDVFRGGAWFLFLIVLMRPLWPGGMRWPAILAASTVLAQVLGLTAEYFGDFQGAAMRPVLVSWLAHAVVGLILVEHLYRALPGASRWGSSRSVSHSVPATSSSSICLPMRRCSRASMGTYGLCAGLRMRC